MNCGVKSEVREERCAGCGAAIGRASEALENLRRTSLELLDRGEWDAARMAASQWYRLALFSIEADQFLDQVERKARLGERAREDESGIRGEAPEVAPDPRVIEEELDRLMRSAEDAEKDERWSDALEGYDEILRLSPGDSEIEKRRAAARRKQRDLLSPLFNKAREAAAMGDLALAARTYEKLWELLPWDLEPLRGWEEVRETLVAERVGRRRRRRLKSVLRYAAAAVAVVLITVPATYWIDRAMRASEVPVTETSGSSEGESDLAGGKGLSGENLSGGSLATAVGPDGGRGEPPRPGERKRLDIAGVSFAFRWIPSGEAVIGSPEDEACRDEDESRWTARFSTGFWLSETEVTQAQWREIMDVEPWGPEYCGRCPVTRISWHDAQEFVARLDARVRHGKVRLPYEAEWEYAARAGSEDPYGLSCSEYGPETCDGANPGCLDDFAWHGANAGDAPSFVGTKKPNAWGLADMHGNVAEWCSDWYGAYPGGVRTDYSGPPDGDRKVQRGGGLQQGRYLRSANRTGVSPSYRLGTDTGFRILFDPADTRLPS